MKAAYYREGAVGSSFEAVGFIADYGNSAENRLLLKPIGGMLVTYIGFPEAEFKLQTENDFTGFDAYFKSVIFPTYKEIPYS